MTSKINKVNLHLDTHWQRKMLSLIYSTLAFNIILLKQWFSLVSNSINLKDSLSWISALETKQIQSFLKLKLILLSILFHPNMHVIAIAMEVSIQLWWRTISMTNSIILFTFTSQMRAILVFCMSWLFLMQSIFICPAFRLPMSRFIKNFQFCS